MNQYLLLYVLLSLAFVVVFVLGDLLLLRFHWQPEHSRKFVHIASGMLASTFPFVFPSHWWVLAMCSSFMVLLYLSLKFNFLKGINAIGRKTYGSIVYPIAVYLCYLFYAGYGTEGVDYHLFLIPILLLTFPDPAAALVGRNFPIKRFSEKEGAKSWGGSLAFMVCAVFLVFVPLKMYTALVDHRIWVISLVVALITAAIEAGSQKGLDNLFVPLGACICLYFL